MSLFELPVSRGARWARIAAVLVLDAVLVGAGVAMIASYLDARERARKPQPTVEPSAQIEGLAPRPVTGAAVAGATAGATGSAATGAAAGGAQPRVATPAGSSSAGSRDATGDSTPPPGARAPRPDRGADPARRTEPAGPASGGQSDDGGGQGDGDGSSAGGRVADAPTNDDIARLTREFSLLVSRQQGQLQRCYNNAAKVTNPSDPLAGRVEVRSQILPSGAVSGARPVSNTTGSQQLAECVATLVQSWQFSPIPGDEPLEFVWPFQFKAPR
jgi:TonB family protein